MARTRTDAEKYRGELESIHVQIPSDVKHEIRMAAAASKQSMAVLLREVVMVGWRQVYPLKKES